MRSCLTGPHLSGVKAAGAALVVCLGFPVPMIKYSGKANSRQKVYSSSQVQTAVHRGREESLKQMVILCLRLKESDKPMCVSVWITFALLRKVYFIFICVCARTRVRVYACAIGGQKKTWNPLGLEPQVPGNSSTQVLGAKLGSSAKAASGLNTLSSVDFRALRTSIHSVLLTLELHRPQCGSLHCY